MTVDVLEVEEQMNENVNRTFIKLTPVIDISFLDQELVLSCVNQCVVSESGDDQDYVLWDMTWDFSPSAKKLSNYLATKGIPRSMNVLLKLTNFNDDD